MIPQAPPAPSNFGVLLWRRQWLLREVEGRGAKQEKGPGRRGLPHPQLVHAWCLGNKQTALGRDANHHPNNHTSNPPGTPCTQGTDPLLQHPEPLNSGDPRCSPKIQLQKPGAKGARDSKKTNPESGGLLGQRGTRTVPREHSLQTRREPGRKPAATVSIPCRTPKPTLSKASSFSSVPFSGGGGRQEKRPSWGCLTQKPSAQPSRRGFASVPSPGHSPVLSGGRGGRGGRGDGILGTAALSARGRRSATKLPRSSAPRVGARES